MKKFKVGDFVKGNALSDRRYSITNSKMTKGEVIKVNPSGSIDIIIREHDLGYAMECEFYALESKCFDKITSDWKVLIIPDGDKTIGKLFENGKVTKRVETKKHPKDEYSINEAIKSITARLVEEAEETKEPEAKFKVGDIVEVIRSTGSGVPVGTRGEVVKVTRAFSTNVLVDFKVQYPHTHTIGGFLKEPTGWIFLESSIKLVHRP